MVAPKVSSVSVVDGLTVDVIFDQEMTQDAVFFNPGNYAVTPGHTVSAVAAPNTETARLTITPEQQTSASLTATVNALLENAGGEAMDGAALSAAFSGIGDHPQVASAAASSDTVVRVTFDEGMLDDAELRDVSNYSLMVALGGVIPTILTAIPEAVTNPTYVDLTLASEMTDGSLYNVAVGALVADAVGNPMDAGNDNADFTGSGTEPGVTTIQLRDTARTVRVFFDEGMKRDAALSSTANYSFAIITPGAAPIFIGEVVLPSTPTNPTYVDLIVSEMTDSASYELIVSTSGATDPANNFVNGAANVVAFSGVGEAPTISNVIGVSKNRADVVFNEPMKDNSDIREASRYTWTGGLVTLDVLEVASDTVKLVTSDQTPGVLYTLTVDPT